MLVLYQFNQSKININWSISYHYLSLKYLLFIIFHMMHATWNQRNTLLTISILLIWLGLLAPLTLTFLRVPQFKTWFAQPTLTLTDPLGTNRTMFSHFTMLPTCLPIWWMNQTLTSLFRTFPLILFFLLFAEFAVIYHGSLGNSFPTQHTHKW